MLKNKQTNKQWINIHTDFAEVDLVKEWTKCGFKYEEVEKWKNIFGNNFDPYKYQFINWLKNNGWETKIGEAEVHLTEEDIKLFEEIYKKSLTDDDSQKEEWEISGPLSDEENFIIHFLREWPEFEKEKEELKKFFEEFRQIIEEKQLEKEIADKKEANYSLSLLIEKKDSQLQDKEKKINELEKNLQKKDGEIGEKNKKIQELEQSITELGSNSDSDKETIEDLKKIRVSLEKKLKENEKIVDETILSQLDEEREKSQKLQNEKNDSKKEVQKFASELKKVSQEAALFKSASDEREREWKVIFDRLNGDIEAMKEEKEHYKIYYEEAIASMTPRQEIAPGSPIKISQSPFSVRSRAGTISSSSRVGSYKSRRNSAKKPQNSYPDVRDIFTDGLSKALNEVVTKETGVTKDSSHVREDSSDQKERITKLEQDSEELLEIQNLLSEFRFKNKSDFPENACDDKETVKWLIEKNLGLQTDEKETFFGSLRTKLTSFGLPTPTVSTESRREKKVNKTQLKRNTKEKLVTIQQFINGLVRNECRSESDYSETLKKYQQELDELDLTTLKNSIPELYEEVQNMMNNLTLIIQQTNESSNIRQENDKHQKVMDGMKKNVEDFLLERQKRLSSQSGENVSVSNQLVDASSPLPIISDNSVARSLGSNHSSSVLSLSRFSFKDSPKNKTKLEKLKTKIRDLEQEVNEEREERSRKELELGQREKELSELKFSLSQYLKKQLFTIHELEKQKESLCSFIDKKEKLERESNEKEGIVDFFKTAEKNVFQKHIVNHLEKITEKLEEVKVNWQEVRDSIGLANFPLDWEEALTVFAGKNFVLTNVGQSILSMLEESQRCIDECQEALKEKQIIIYHPYREEEKTSEEVEEENERIFQRADNITIEFEQLNQKEKFFDTLETFEEQIKTLGNKGRKAEEQEINELAGIVLELRKLAENLGIDAKELEDSIIIMALDSITGNEELIAQLSDAYQNLPNNQNPKKEKRYDSPDKFFYKSKISFLEKLSRGLSEDLEKEKTKVAKLREKLAGRNKLKSSLLNHYQKYKTSYKYTGMGVAATATAATLYYNWPTTISNLATSLSQNLTGHNLSAFSQTITSLAAMVFSNKTVPSWWELKNHPHTMNASSLSDNNLSDEAKNLYEQTITELQWFLNGNKSYWEAQNSELKGKHDDFLVKLDDNQQSLNETKNQLAQQSLQQQENLTNLTNLITKKTRLNHKLTELVHNKTLTNQEKEHKIAKLTKKLNQTEQKEQLLLKGLASLYTEWQTNARSANEKQTLINELELTNQKLTQELGNLKVSWQNSELTFNQTNANLAQNLTTSQSTEKQLQKQSVAFQQQVQKREAVVANLTNKNRSLQEKINQLSDELTSTHTKLNLAKNQNNNVQTQLTDSQAKFLIEQKNYNQTKQELTKEQTAHNLTKNLLNEQDDQVQTKLTTLSQKLNKTLTSKTELESKYNTTQRNLLSEQQTHNQTKLNLEEVNNSITFYQNDLHTAQAKVQQAEKFGLTKWDNLESQTQNETLTSLLARPDINITKEEWENDYLQRPTQQQLTEAVNKEKAKYQNFIDPANLETKAQQKGMVSLKEFNQQPNITNEEFEEDYKNGLTKQEQQALANKVKAYEHSLKNQFSITDLANWEQHLVKKSEVKLLQEQLRKLKLKLKKEQVAHQQNQTQLQDYQEQRDVVLKELSVERQALVSEQAKIGNYENELKSQLNLPQLTNNNWKKALQDLTNRPTVADFSRTDQARTSFEQKVKTLLNLTDTDDLPTTWEVQLATKAQFTTINAQVKNYEELLKTKLGSSDLTNWPEQIAKQSDLVQANTTIANYETGLNNLGITNLTKWEQKIQAWKNNANKLIAVEKKLLTLQDNNHSLNSIITNYEATLTSKEQSLLDLTAQLNAEQTNLSKEQQEHQKTKTERDNAQISQVKAEEERDARPTVAELNVANARIDTLDKEKTQVEDALQEANNAKNAAKKSLQTWTKAFKTKSATEVANELNTAHQERQELEEAKEQLLQSFRAKDQELVTAQHQITNLTAERDNYQHERDNLELSLTTAETKATNLEKKTNKLTKDLKLAKSTNQSLQKQANSLQAQLTVELTNHAETKSHLTASEKAIVVQEKAWVKQKTALEDKNQVLKSKKTKLAKELSIEKNQHQKTSQKVTDLTTECTNLTAQIATKNTELTELDQTLAETYDILAKKNATISDYWTNIEKLAREKQTLHQELLTKDHEITDKNNKIAQQDTEIQQWVNNYKQLQTDLHQEQDNNHLLNSTITEQQNQIKDQQQLLFDLQEKVRTNEQTHEKIKTTNYGVHGFTQLVISGITYFVTDKKNHKKFEQLAEDLKTERQECHKTENERDNYKKEISNLKISNDKFKEDYEKEKVLREEQDRVITNLSAEKTAAENNLAVAQTHLTNLTTQLTAKDNQIQDLQTQLTNTKVSENQLLVEQLNSSLGLNLPSETTLAEMITIIKELIAKPPTIINNSQRHQTAAQNPLQFLAGVKKEDLAWLKDILSGNDYVLAYQQISNSTSYSQLAEVRNSLVNKQLSQTDNKFQLVSQHNNSLVKQKNLLWLLLAIGLLGVTILTGKLKTSQTRNKKYLHSK